MMKYLKIAINAMGKFLKYVYAPYLVSILMSLLYYMLGFPIIGIAFFVLTVYFLLNEINQNID